MKMRCRNQASGLALGSTRSLESEIMAPSLKTAKKTIRMAGKYLPDEGNVNKGTEMMNKIARGVHHILEAKQHAVASGPNVSVSALKVGFAHTSCRWS